MESFKNIFVSVILPIYNAEATIEQCLQSILKQNYPKDEYEIIVVNNQSTDRTLEIIHSFQLPILHEVQIHSSYASRNRGIKNAKGEVLAFIDADCIADESWLEQGVKYFEDPLIGCVAGAIQAFSPKTEVEKYLTAKDELSQIKTDSNFQLPYAKTANAFYRKKVFDQVGLFEEKWISGGDADMSWRMQLKTSLRLQYAENAITYHKHRSTVKAMLHQCVKWGVGYRLLAKKYPDLFPPETMKQKARSLWHVIRGGMQIIRKFLSVSFGAKTINKKDYDLISSVGWEAGKIAGYFYL